MFNPATHRLAVISLLLCCLFMASACGTDSVTKEAKYPTGADRSATNDDIYAEAPSIFGSGGLFGRAEEDGGGDGQTGIGVNSFLWRASLDTVSFMPLASADPFGGVILTDWYSPPEDANERFKLNVFILDRQLRSDGIQVKVFRQVRKGGGWQDSETSESTARQLEEAILTRARQMRVASLGDDG